MLSKVEVGLLVLYLKSSVQLRLADDISSRTGVLRFQDNDLTPAIFCRYPFLLNLADKVAVSQIFASITRVFTENLMIR